LVRRRLGGWLVSAVVENHSHWFNRLRAGKHLVDVDLTGDQFGRRPIQIAIFGHLYTGTRVRRPTELLPETLARSHVLEKRARFDEALDRLGPGNARHWRRPAAVGKAGAKKTLSEKPGPNNARTSAGNSARASAKAGPDSRMRDGKTSSSAITKKTRFHSSF
jgi:hypothetical protein